MRLRRGVVAVAAAAAFAVGACTNTGGGATVAPATQPPATTAPAAGSPAAAGLSLVVAQDATLGSYVTGKDGKALYVFTPDTGDTSNCNDDCAANWPPLTVTMASDVAAGTGVTGQLGTITRSDGALQVTLGGHPLYHFKGDAAAGDVNGQGLNDVWFLAGPDGNGVGMTSGGEPTSGAEATPCPPADRTCY